MSTFDDIKRRLAHLLARVDGETLASSGWGQAHRDASAVFARDLRTIIASWPADVYREQADALTAHERACVEDYRENVFCQSEASVLLVIDRLAPRPEETT